MRYALLALGALMALASGPTCAYRLLNSSGVGLPMMLLLFGLLLYGFGRLVSSIARS